MLLLPVPAAARSKA